MISDFFKRLNEPFPNRSSFRQAVRQNLGVAVFIALFLYLFKPFGLDQVRVALFFICMGFGAVTLLASCAYDAFCRFVLKIQTDVPSWTLWKWSLQSILVVCWIAVWNYFYVVLVYDIPLDSYNEFFLMLKSTLLLGSLPVVFSGIMLQMRAVKANVKEAQTIHPRVDDKSAQASPLTPGVISFDISSSESLEVEYDDLRCIEAMQNYVSVHYTKEQVLRSELLRSTIAKMQETFAQTSVIRCHRSYLVNLDAIEHISGNAQGLKLKLKDVDSFEVPVSRSYIATLKAQMS